ncbi:protoglobin domain-containing protein [Chroococcus sp. FPU101]|uniref:protoglobin domain-containing protein n=1 Tax=Chroococcus sp. FPU101 TaxID=1974212 RepID=UPI001A8D1A86|nr:protoglobin domain-containing protein [Chroococcus sp. FPU101]GFE69233.1 hypothetical protein CFPU101_18430 [Chroococcus sp. FPU101]
MTLNPQEFMQKMEQRMLFSNSDKAILNFYADWGKTVVSEMTNCFYDYLGRDPEMSSILNASDGRIHRLRETFIEWFQEMFTGMDAWGTNYAERRWRIGLIHVRVGIGPQHVVPAMATVVREITQKLQAESKGNELRDALSKICMIDLAFIEQAYIKVSSKAVLKESGWTEGSFRRLIATDAAVV